MLKLLALAAAVALTSIPGSWTARERAAAARVDVAGILGHVRFLSSDLTEGRAPGSRGDEIAMAYIAAQMERAGLQPAGDGGSWLQRFDLIAMKGTLAQPATIRGDGETITLHPGEDAVIAPGVQRPEAKVQNAEVVFVGYGITAPEEKWDDWKGVDVRGKVVLVMNNDPETDPKRFAGKTRLYYGRWTYKYEEAARHGAVGAIVIHTTPSAGYPWQVVQTSWNDELFELPAREGEPRLQAKMWVSDEIAHRIARLGHQDLDELRRRAERDDFHPVPLGVKVSASMTVATRKITSANVLGVLPGSDATAAKEEVVFTAHHDHLGVRQAKSGDAIYNGALDNASGVAALLELADAIAHTTPRPRRSILFAAVGAEEANLLGSQFLAEHPKVPPAQMVANLNFDGVNIYGRTTDVELIGRGKSELDGYVELAAKQQGRIVKPDQFPDRGSFYRSDQLSFAHVGVPVIYLRGGVDFPGHDEAWGRARVDQYVKERYHQPSDELNDQWNLDGAVDDLRLALVVGLRIADAKRAPAWTPGGEFHR